MDEFEMYFADGLDVCGKEKIQIFVFSEYIEAGESSGRKRWLLNLSAQLCSCC